MKLTRRQFIASLGTIAGNSLIPIDSSSEIFGAWPVLREWNFNEFHKYSDWVRNIYKFKRDGTGKQKGAKIDRVMIDDEMNLLNNPDFLQNGNAQLGSDDLGLLKAMCHCGSFPELLFLYYNYRRGLPAVVSQIKMKKGGDIRYSYGNHPVGSVDSVSFNGNFRGFLSASMEGGENGFNFVSGNFRTAPDLEATDSVPISINQSSLVPGTMCYNANGHCLVVGDIDSSGEIHFLDSHPDHSITFNQTLSAIPFVKSAELGVSGLSRCYDGFRVMRFAKMQGGKAVHFTNQEMLEFGYSIEQYKLMAELNENGSIEINGEKVSDYPGIVRASLRTGIESPVKFLESSVLEFSEMLEERAEFVRQAWNDVLQNGVITFPNDSSEENIYQANGRWEVWSSPSSDVDRKNKYSYFTQRLKSMLENFGNSQICDYSGFSSRKALAEFLIKRKEELFLEKGIVYENSSGKSFRLALSDIESRLFDMSFDPNHPPELRWGAPENSEERQGMKLFKTPLRTGESLDALTAYNLEKGLRYYPVRQATPTSLNLEANPKTPPFELFNKVLASYLAP
ncbi:hypothetical protein J4463_00415 [Candidatus Pacearchaeota archaeon]|nr:hypothetical protein [Candidatus Pacearchaeota archaeon]